MNRRPLALRTWDQRPGRLVRFQCDPHSLGSGGFAVKWHLTARQSRCADAVPRRCRCVPAFCNSSGRQRKKCTIFPARKSCFKRDRTPTHPTDRGSTACMLIGLCCADEHFARRAEQAFIGYRHSSERATLVVWRAVFRLRRLRTSKPNARRRTRCMCAPSCMCAPNRVQRFRASRKRPGDGA
jgi:hypothetical protein